MTNEYVKKISIALLGIAIYCNITDARGANNTQKFVDITCEKVICDYINEMNNLNIQQAGYANVIAFECLVKIGNGEEHNAIIVLKNGRFDDPCHPRYLRTSNSGIDVTTIPPVYYISVNNLMNSCGGINEYALMTKKTRNNPEWEERIAKFVALDKNEQFVDRDNLNLFNDIKSPELQFAVLKDLGDVNTIKLVDDMYITLTGIKDVEQIYAVSKPQYYDLNLLVNNNVSISYFEDSDVLPKYTDKMNVLKKISCEDYCTREIQ